MSLDPRLARFQEQLLLGLADGTPLDELRSASAATAPDSEVADWVASWDPELLDLAGVLVRTWCRRDKPAARPHSVSP